VNSIACRCANGLLGRSADRDFSTPGADEIDLVVMAIGEPASTRREVSQRRQRNCRSCLG